MAPLALKKGPETVQSPESDAEVISLKERARISTVLNEPSEEAVSLKDLHGTDVPYQGNMIPCKSGSVRITATTQGLSLGLSLETDDGSRLEGHLSTDEYGQKAVITDSTAALNNYFRYRYPAQAQELADELLAPAKTN